MLPFIDLKAQQARIRKELDARIAAVLDHGQYIMGPEIAELEKRLADYCGAARTICCSSGTDALLLPLLAWDIGPGDAVFTTPFTFFATAEVIRLLGATPVFVDIDPVTFNIDPAALALAVKALRTGNPALHPLPAGYQKLTPKAVIPVDLFGIPANYDEIGFIAQAEGLKVLEDAAQSFGSSRGGVRAGAFGHAAATSFFPAKPLGGYGDGGAVFTNDEELAETLVSLRIHGMSKLDKYENLRIGLNARLDTLQAAVLLPKLDIFPDELEQRQRAAATYGRLIAQRCPDVTPPHVPQGCVSAWAQYSVLARDTAHRSALQAALRTAEVPTAIYYPKPLHLQTAFAALDHKAGDFPVSEERGSRIFSLPMHPYLADETIATIVDAMAGA